MLKVLKPLIQKRERRLNNMQTTEFDCRQMIEEMLDKIENQKTLKRILNYICYVYVKSTDQECERTK